jgi:hypothetical protein
MRCRWRWRRLKSFFMSRLSMSKMRGKGIFLLIKL